MDLKLEQLRVFLAVLRLKSFSAAGKELGVSKVAISKQITTLENNLKCKLFERTTRRIKLTEQGKLLVEYAEKMLNHAEDINNLFSTLQKEPSGTLRIMCTPYISQVFMIPHLNKFIKQYPIINLELKIEERFPNLELEKIDLFIGASMPGYDDLVRKQISSTRYVVCASSQYLKKFGTPKKPEQLKNHRYITHSMRIPDNILVFNEKIEIEVNPFLRINDTQAMIDCALRHLGVIKVHEYFVRKYLNTGQLIEIFKPYHKKVFPIYLFYPYTKYLTQKTRAMIDFIDLHLN